MNKTLKFAKHLVPLVQSGEKTTTWRLFDDKDLTAGNTVDFLEADSKQKFATARLLQVTEKMFSELDEADWAGHEKFASDQAMYYSYTMMYNKPVTPGTLVKIIKFKLL
jgi:hypothetical protein